MELTTIIDVRLVDCPSDMEPAIKEKDLKGIDTVLSYYTTHFDASAADRDENIKICQNLLTHALVPAGKAFSFNDTLWKPHMFLK